MKNRSHNSDFQEINCTGVLSISKKEAKFFEEYFRKEKEKKSKANKVVNEMKVFNIKPSIK
jgi:hypothetical protein